MARRLPVLGLMFAVTLVCALTFFLLITHTPTAAAPDTGVHPAPTPQQSQASTSQRFLPSLSRAYHTLEPPALSWASGPEGVLLRWRWPKWMPAATAFTVYRDGTRVATVRRVTDPQQAIAILGNDTWAWLQSTYSLTTIADLHTFLDANPLVELWLADQKYPVALVRGLGYLDENVTRGTTYEYRVQAVTAQGPKDVGTLRVTYQGFTPLPAPSGLQEVQVADPTLMGSSDWAMAQRNRKANARVFLRWDLPQPAMGEPWISAYDVYRARLPGGPYTRINVEGGEDKPVIPMPSYTPPGETGSYQRYPYFYADTDPSLQACRPYYYRIAPRDLLGHIANWDDPGHRHRFSPYLRVVPPDTEPPAAPVSVTATANDIAGVITVTWKPVTDAVRYIVFRSTDLEAAWPGTSSCVTCATWMPMTMTTALTWTDTSAQYETRYWYVVRALDAPCRGHPPNMSAPSQAVPAILHDRTPPTRCHIESSPRRPLMHITCGEDTTDILIYCRFDNGPELLVQGVKGKQTDYDLSTFYTPALPIHAACRAVAVDEHGNRAAPSDWSASLPLVPPHLPTPSAPILHPITTTLGGNHGWTAHLHWDAIDTPCVAGFRVYRASPGVPEVRVADESTLDRTTREFADPDVEWGVVYTYTVAAYGAGGICGTAKEIRSQPVVYRVVQPPNYPGRTVGVIHWSSHYYDDQGTHLSWAIETKRIKYVVFRSLHRTHGYVAITPPMERNSYLDTSAHDGRYWYMVLALDRSTGEPFAATSSWSAGTTAQTHPKEAASQLAPEEPSRLPRELPSILYFGDGFTLHVTSYTPGSSLKDLSGEGNLYFLYPSRWFPLRIHLSFAHLQAKSDGTVTDGSVTVPNSALPIHVHKGFSYDVTSLTVDPTGGTGSVKLYLPTSVAYHWHFVYPFPTTGLDDYVLLGNATIHADLRFQRMLNWNLSCEDATQTYFQLEDLPWKIIPTAPATYTNEGITFSAACALYLERYTDDRPPLDEPDANDGLLRAVYTSSDAAIEPDGLTGTFATGAHTSVRYTVPFPYGFYLTLYHPVLTLDGGEIISGTASSSSLWKSGVSFDYFQHIARTNPHHGAVADSPEGHWTGNLTQVRIGRGGSIYARATKVLAYPQIPDISWLNGGFTLHDQTFELFISPLQSIRLPWQDALWSTDMERWPDGTTLEPGLNLRTSAGESAHLAWEDCSTNGPVTFPQGVTADLYIRRAGVSDLLQAHIPTGSPMDLRLDGYQTRLQSFTLVFFDNTLYDRDISGAFYLPMPTDALIPFRDATLDGNGCLASAEVTVANITPRYWQVTLHPQALEFRPPDPDPSAPGGRGLWLIGGVDVPHMAPVTSTEEVAAIPLETAFKPSGEFYRINLQYDGVNYLLDGFAYLLSGVRLSDWASHEAPSWDASATLASPPSGTWDAHGFVQVDGRIEVPIFGPLVGKGTNDPPHVYVLGWDRYLGFSKQVEAKRTWTVLTDITWDFDLVYAQHPERNRGTFAGFRHDDLYVVELDQALVLNTTVEDTPRFDIFLGLSSGTAVLRSLADTTQISLPEKFADIRGTVEGWRSSHFSDMDSTYVDFLGTLWEKYGDSSTGYTNTTALIDGMKDKDIPVPPEGPLAGGTKEWLDASGVKFKKLRGNVTWVQDTNTGDWDFAEMRMSIWLDIRKTTTTTEEVHLLGDEKPSKEKVLLHADRITFYITRDNDYVVEGKNIKGAIFKGSDVSVKSFDATLAINTDKIRFEGGVVMHKLKVKGVTFDPADAVLGVGRDVYYLGALADAKYKNVKVGGSFLFGRLDPNSIVLRNIGFTDLLDNMGVISGSPTSLAGGYLRAYGDVPIYESGCMYRLHAGGEIAIWYFANLSPGQPQNAAWGGRLTGYVYGKLLCVVAARGDLTFQLWQRDDRDGFSYRGQFWVAGGIGSCEPKDWDTWENRWWGDSWCWTCGALIQADYNDTVPGEWKWTTDADYE